MTDQSIEMKALTARIREAQTDTPKTAEEAAQALHDALQPGGPGVIVCYTRCWACQFEHRLSVPGPTVEDAHPARQGGKQSATGRAGSDEREQARPESLAVSAGTGLSCSAVP